MITETLKHLTNFLQAGHFPKYFIVYPGSSNKKVYSIVGCFMIKHSFILVYDLWMTTGPSPSGSHISSLVS